MQSPNGAWHDFWTPAGTSDEWVTAYVAAALALSPDVESRASVTAAWRYLIEESRSRCGWGYCRQAPSDADSTAWALILADRIGEQASPPARDALGFISSSCVLGGVATYVDVSDIRGFVDASPLTSFSGWAQAHSCVTATACRISSLQSRLIPDTLAFARPDGSWPSYWWFEDAYATAMAVVALSGAGRPDARDAVARACKWAYRQLEDERELSPFQLSLLLAILQRDSRRSTSMLRCAVALITQQRADGSWRGSAHLRIPRPDISHPSSVESWERWWGSENKFNIFSVDQYSVFTTATAYSALHASSARETGDASAAL